MQLDDKGDKSYHIYWQSAVLHYTEKGAFAGTMQTVHGDLFSKGEPRSTFDAESGVADRPGNLLKLSGRVHVHSAGKSSEERPKREDQTGSLDLYCDNLEWHTDVNIIKATGHVTVKTEGGGIVGPMDELWSTVEMNKLASKEQLKVKSIGTSEPRNN